jgi:hypothetical protein
VPSHRSFVFLCALGLATPAAGQTLGRVVFVGEIGRQFLRENVRVDGIESLFDRTNGFVVSGSVGLPIRSWFVPEFAMRTTVGDDYPFRSASLGVGLRHPQFNRAHLHLAVAGVLAYSTGWTCPETTRGCPRHLDRRLALDVRAGFDLFKEAHFSLGPTAWWQKTLERNVSYVHLRYRTLGIGVQIGFH